MLNVVCFKWKPIQGYRSQFGPETVNILKQMVKRHYRRPHTFTCVTDDPKGLDADVRVVPLWKDFHNLVNPYGQRGPSCYRRLKLFAPEARELFGERIVSLDLDCVIVEDLAPLWDRPEDIVLWGDTNPSTYYNGSMVLMTTGARPQVWRDFNPARSPMAAKQAGQFGSDQGWISHRLGPNEAKWGTADGVFSFRLHLRNRRNADLPPGARIVMFHGTTDPWSPQAARLAWVRQNWCYDPTAHDGIEAVNLPRGCVLLADGRFMPIVSVYDEDGGAPATLGDVASFVAGRDGSFWSGTLAHYRRMTAH